MTQHTDSLATANAADHWDDQWATEAGREDWITPEQDVVEATDLLEKQGVKNAVDLGCGVGRHALFLAQQGLKVFAYDASQSGLDFLQSQADQLDLNITSALADMYNMPLEDNAADCVVSWNVIYHGNLEILTKSVGEINRILRPGGVLILTLLPKTNHMFGVGIEVDEDTWMVDAGSDKEYSDKAHPHCYVDAKGITDLFHNYEILKMRQQEHQKKDSWHWHLTMVKQ